MPLYRSQPHISHLHVEIDAIKNEENAPNPPIENEDHTPNLLKNALIGLSFTSLCSNHDLPPVVYGHLKVTPSLCGTREQMSSLPAIAHA